MPEGEYKEMRFYLRFTTYHQWKGLPKLRVTITKTKKAAGWNDFIVPIDVKLPMFLEQEPVEVILPANTEGEVALEILKGDTDG